MSSAKDPAAETQQIDTERKRWKFLASGAVIFAGFVAVANMMGGVKSAVEVFKMVAPWLEPKTCKGQPIADIRQKIAENLRAGGDFYSAARWRAQDLLECIKDDSDTLNSLGAIEFYTGNFAQAEQYFRRAMKSKPENRVLQLNLADVLVELGRYEGALSEYRALNDGSNALTYKIGRTLLLSHKFAEARRTLSSVGTDFGDEARPGKARILEAAAIVGQAKMDPAQRDELMAAARHNFQEGYDMDRIWWRETLLTKKYNRYEPFGKVVALLGDSLQQWVPQ